MGTGQMLLVLLAVVLFSSILLANYEQLFSQIDLVTRGMVMLQGQSIADSIFQRIQTDYLNDPSNYCVDDVISNYDTSGTKYMNNYFYNYTISVSKCNVAGDVSTPTEDAVKVDIVMTCPVGNDTVRIGTATNPMSKLYYDLFN